MNKETIAADEASGIVYGIIAYTAWGILPLYWKLLQDVPALEILAHRIIWSFTFVGALVIVSRQTGLLSETLKDRRKLLFIFASGFLISLNWFTYIWAVNSGKVIEASMGYYINPLVVVLFGVVILKEKLNAWHIVAIALAAAGVIIITVQYGQVPKVALLLACTFALYGLSKKLVKVDSITGLFLETLIVMPLAFIYIISKEAAGRGALGTLPLLSAAILVGSGVATATPLLWFTRAAQRIRLSTLGFLQYIAPSLSLLLGIFIFKEKFSAVDLISFSFIWAGLAIFVLTNLGLLQSARGGGKAQKSVS